MGQKNWTLASYCFLYTARCKIWFPCPSRQFTTCCLLNRFGSSTSNLNASNWPFFMVRWSTLSLRPVTSSTESGQVETSSFRTFAPPFDGRIMQKNPFLSPLHKAQRVVSHDEKSDVEDEDVFSDQRVPLIDILYVGCFKQPRIHLLGLRRLSRDASKGVKIHGKDN
ncbi:hypothetical protein EUGRSUZ_D01206 [Eucalyptus grandis]|uniref:Uncharacterized protein n=2 Tax=Eucalyptus grandis TaxID=71139 RepID=A0ACC3L566_EUCGR|nr:hypothetical protein EUGRSUZ_D01206 [Eucalyptus grandis]